MSNNKLGQSNTVSDDDSDVAESDDGDNQILEQFKEFFKAVSGDALVVN